MTNIRLSVNAGAAFFDASANRCFHRLTTTPTLGVADTVLATGDRTRYAAYTWKNDDDNVAAGTTHRTWTACQMCVADQFFAQFDALEDENGSWTTVFAASRAGVLRWWMDQRYYETLQYRINGVDMGLVGTGRNQYYAYALRLTSGDAVEVRRDYDSPPDNTLNLIFCPYVYP